VLVRSATYQEAVDWASTRPLLPDVVSELTLEIEAAVVDPAAIVGGDAPPGE
jgi:hypothetical protein